MHGRVLLKRLPFVDKGVALLVEQDRRTVVLSNWARFVTYCCVAVYVTSTRIQPMMDMIRPLVVPKYVHQVLRPSLHSRGMRSWGCSMAFITVVLSASNMACQQPSFVKLTQASISPLSGRSDYAVSPRIVVFDLSTSNGW